MGSSRAAVAPPERPEATNDDEIKPPGRGEVLRARLRSSGDLSDEPHGAVAAVLALASMMPLLILVSCAGDDTSDAGAETVDAGLDVSAAETVASAPTDPAVAPEPTSTPAPTATSVPSPTPVSVNEIEFPRTVGDFSRRWTEAVAMVFEEAEDGAAATMDVVSLPDSTVSRTFGDGTPYEAFELFPENLEIQFVIDDGIIERIRMFTLPSITGEPSVSSIRIARAIWLTTFVGSSGPPAQQLASVVNDAAEADTLPIVFRGIEWNAEAGLLLEASPRPGVADSVDAPPLGEPAEAVEGEQDQTDQVDAYWRTCDLGPDELPGRSDDYKDAFAPCFKHSLMMRWQIRRCSSSSEFPPNSTRMEF